MSKTVAFTTMDDATTEEMLLIRDMAVDHKNHAWLDTVLNLLESMKGNTFGYQVDRYEHSIQTATRASRDGARADLVVAALLHDIGDDLAPDNHAEVAAAILKPVLDDEALWVVKHHGIFQAYHYGQKLGVDANVREKYRGHEYFDSCARFCADWDQKSFDPDYDSMPLTDFIPQLREVFARSVNWGS